MAPQLGAQPLIADLESVADLDVACMAVSRQVSRKVSRLKVIDGDRSNMLVK
jgi:hypothetical protein